MNMWKIWRFQFVPAFNEVLVVVVIATGSVPFAHAQVGSLPSAIVGTPPHGGTVSGVSTISGYHCHSRKITILIDGVSIGPAGAGTYLGATENVCGQPYSGFSLLYNFNNLPVGEHTITALADGVAFGTVTVRTLKSAGEQWHTGGARTLVVRDFPRTGSVATLDWIESYQNFVVTSLVSATDCGPGTTFAATIGQCVYSLGIEVSPLVVNAHVVGNDWASIRGTGKVRYIATGAIESGASERPVVFAYFHHEGFFCFNTCFPHSVRVIYADDFSVAEATPDWSEPGSIAASIWAKGTDRGLLVKADGVPAQCAELRWHPPPVGRWQYIAVGCE